MEENSKEFQYQFEELIGSSLVPERSIIIDGGGHSAWSAAWERARDEARKSQLDEACKYYAALLQKYPNIQQARWELAAILIRLKDWAGATDHLELLVEYDQDNVTYLAALARVLLKNSRYDRAVSLFERILNIQPERITALNGIIFSFLQLKQPDNTLPYLEILHRLDPTDGGVRLSLALLYEKLGNDDMARPHLVALSQSQDAKVDLLVRTAAVHDRLGLENLAKDYWQRALGKSSEHVMARRRLAEIKEQAGNFEEALEYLLPILDKVPVDNFVLRQVARLYLKDGKYSDALPYLKKYGDSHQYDKQIVRDLVDVYAALGNREEIITVLERYYALEPDSGEVELKHAARHYDVTGRFREALPFYRRLLAIAPDDPEILATLANDLLNVAQGDGILGMRRHFQRLGPKRVELYRSMADLLERLGRHEEYLEVLETIHDLQPSDAEVSLKLANIFFEKGDLTKSLYFYERLALAGHRDSLFFEGRGKLFENSEKKIHALEDFEEFLLLSPERHDIRLRAIRLAGELGLLESVRRHFNKLEAYTPGEISPDIKLVVAAAYRDCGAFGEANTYYQRLLETTALEDNVVFQIYLGIAESHQQAGLPFEAEESLRKALAINPDDPNVMARLFAASMKNEGDQSNSLLWWSRWLASKSMALDSHGLANRLKMMRWSQWKMTQLRAKVAAVGGDLDEAITLATDLFEELTDENIGGYSEDFYELWRSIGIDLAQYLLREDEPKEAAIICHTILRESRITGRSVLQPLLVLLKSYLELEMRREARDVFARILFAARQDTGRMLTVARFAKEYALPDHMLFLAREASEDLPDSLEASFLLAKALEIQGNKEEAIVILTGLIDQQPGNQQAEVMLAHLFFNKGDFQEAFARCDDLLAGDGGRPDILLLKARTLWAMEKWAEAMEVYKGSLTPLAGDEFVLALDKRNLAISVPEENLTFWQTITLSTVPPPTPLDYALDPEGLPRDNFEQWEIGGIALSYLAKHRWQEKFALELSARRAVQRREYFKAIYEYKELMSEYPTEESLLFDLAGIYSRLDMLLDEALLYEKISGLDAYFPGLQNAKERNWLKRRPRGLMGGGFRKEAGYFGYKAVETTWLETSFWMSPRPQHEIDFTLNRAGYNSTDNANRVASRRLFLSYRTHFVNGLSLDMGAGFEDLEDGYASTGLFDCALSGNIGDKLSGRVAVNRDVVSDTTASITRNVVATEISSGISVDLMPHLRVGGDYGVRDFSDNNYTLGYSLLTTYQFFNDPYFLTFKYSYDFKESKEGSQPGPPLADGFGAEDHPYWAPKNYWQNNFEVFFKHQLSKDALRRGVPRYYTIQYTLDYDAFGYGGQTLEGSLFVEWTTRFILEAGALYRSSQLARKREVSLNAVYRW